MGSRGHSAAREAITVKAPGGTAGGDDASGGDTGSGDASGGFTSSDGVLPDTGAGNWVLLVGLSLLLLVGGAVMVLVSRRRA